MTSSPSLIDHNARAEAAARQSRIRWFQEARFGMSLHFGLYSIPGRGEWVRSVERMTASDYRSYFEAFDPEPGWAESWVQTAKDAGARYVVLTAKHHDGFCLFASQLTDFHSATAPCGRDLVREWVEAARAAGLRVGLYYSLVDWHHADYPAWGDRQHPLRHDPASRSRDAGCVWERYVEYLHGQVGELCRNYGKIDLLVFDFSYWDFTGEKWRATELLRMIRRLQPDCLVNDRLGNEALKQGEPPSFAGDYEQCEQNLPREPLRNACGEPIPWEGWITLNNSWCYNPNDRDWKTARYIVHALINCTSKNGNLLLNVSPDATGRLPSEAKGILAGVGSWLERNGESIYRAGAASEPKPEWGRFTRAGDFLYAHVLDPVIGHINLPGLRGRVTDGRVLANGAEAPLGNYWNPGIQTFDAPDDVFFNTGHPMAWTFPASDPVATTVKFRLTTEQERLVLRQKLEAAFEQATARKPF